MPPRKVTLPGDSCAMNMPKASSGCNTRFAEGSDVHYYLAEPQLAIYRDLIYLLRGVKGRCYES